MSAAEPTAPPTEPAVEPAAEPAAPAAEPTQPELLPESPVTGDEPAAEPDAAAKAGEALIAGETSGEEPKQDESIVAGPPDEYSDFDVPEGFDAPPAELVEDYKSFAKDLGLSQEQANRIFAEMAPRYQQVLSETTEQRWQEHIKRGQAEIAKHPVFGGEHYTETTRLLGVATGPEAGFTAEESAKYRQLLSERGLGIEPLFLKQQAAFARLILPTGGAPPGAPGAGSVRKQTLADEYPSMNPDGSSRGKV